MLRSSLGLKVFWGRNRTVPQVFTLNFKYYGLVLENTGGMGCSLNKKKVSKTMDVSLILRRAVSQWGCWRFFTQQPKTPQNLWYLIIKVTNGMLLGCLRRLLQEGSAMNWRILTESTLWAGMLVALQHPYRESWARLLLEPHQPGANLFLLEYFVSSSLKIVPNWLKEAECKLECCTGFFCWHNYMIWMQQSPRPSHKAVI